MTQTHLTPEQNERFQGDGYLVLPAVFSDAEVERMRQEADKILELVINSSLALKRRSQRLDWFEKSDGLPFVRKVQPINDLSSYFAEVSNDARLLDPMRDIMGDEPILMEEKLNCKHPLHAPIGNVEMSSAREDDHFPVHNDWAYYQKSGYPKEIISSALAIDACTPDNGPLRVWPGSHKTHLEHARYGTNELQVLPDLIDFAGGEDVLAPPGSVMFFDALLIHNSRPNATDQPRRLMIYSHYPARFNLGHDTRNGPKREQERPFEDQYREMVRSGEYSDQFRVSP